MTFVTLAMASVVLVWSIGQASTSGSTFSSAINANQGKANERLTIESLLFLPNGHKGGGYSCSAPNGYGCVVAFIRNVGTAQVICDAVYINNQLALQSGYSTGGKVGSEVTIPASTGARLSLGLQQLGSFGVAAPFQLVNGTTYSISVGTTRGSLVTIVQTFT